MNRLTLPVSVAIIVAWVILMFLVLTFLNIVFVDDTPTTKQQAVETWEASPARVCDNPNITCFYDAQGKPISALIPIGDGVANDGQKSVVTMEPLRWAEWMQNNDK